MNIYEILTNKVGTSWQQFHYHDPIPLIKANIIQGCYFAVMSSIDKEFLLNEFYLKSLGLKAFFHAEGNSL